MNTNDARNLFNYKFEDTKHIMQIIKLPFEVITKQKIQSIEDTFPETVHTLFDVALSITEGSFGEKLKSIYFSEREGPISFRTLLVLMAVYISKTSQHRKCQISLPEIFDQLKANVTFKKTFEVLKSIDVQLIECWIFDPKTALEQVPSLKVLIKYLNQLNFKESDERVFRKLFQNFIDQLVNPSPLLIDLLIHQFHFLEKAIETALKIRNPTERSKAIELVIDDSLKRNEIDRAVKLWELIPIKFEKVKTSSKIAAKMIDIGKIDAALKFSDKIIEEESHDRLLREVSLRIAKHHLLNKALEVMKTIKSADIKYYTQTNLVHMLCNQFDFANAKKLALAISEADFKEDAIVDIVKNYLTRRKYNEAIRFINSLETLHEKRKPAKLIETMLKIRHEDEKVAHVRDLFSILKTQRAA